MVLPPPDSRAPMRDIAEPADKTFNLPTRLSTYILDTHTTTSLTFNKLTGLSTYLQDFPLTYKTLNKLQYNKYNRKLGSEPTHETLT